jgi:alanine racemase
VSAPQRAAARVDLGAIERNCARLRGELSEGTQLCAVVKANGYGHGAAAAAEAALAGGAAWLAVATAAEARELRGGGLDSPLLVMGALTPDEMAVALEARADVAAWREGFARAVAERAQAGGPAPRVHVKLDSGMGRLGTADPEEALAVAELVAGDERLELAGAMTHFATADELGDTHFPAQLERFTPFAEQLKRRHPGIVVHAANSAATLHEPAAHFDMVRCGVAVYGLDPYGEDPAERGLEPGLSLESWVAAVKPFRTGDSAGYGRSWKAPEDTWVGTLPIGYGDGWRRALSNDCDVLIRGRRHPAVGTISMDNLTVDLGPDTDVEVGDSGVLIGSQGEERILCEEVAKRLHTINYEVVTGLLPRVSRLYER